MRAVPLKRPNNVALMPANILLTKEAWHQAAAALPTGVTLFILPSGHVPLRRVMVKIAAAWQSGGSRVAVLDVDHLRQYHHPVDPLVLRHPASTRDRDRLERPSDGRR